MDKQTQQIKEIRRALVNVRQALLLDIDGILSRLDALDPSKPTVTMAPKDKEWYRKELFKIKGVNHR